MRAFPTDPAANLETLIRCASVTPADDGALDALSAMVAPLGFTCDRPVFSEPGTADVANLYARLPGNGPHLMFAGHTDVVPSGDPDDWTHAPFGATIAEGQMYGRGAVDMKGGIACFIAALARVLAERGPPAGSVSLLITGDEEGPAINGTAKLLEWAAEKGERWDGCLLGEPTNPDRLGEMIKIGRRGSMSGRITVNGTQGHVAYPHRADNPVRGLLALCTALMETPLDEGTDVFQPSNVEVTSVDTGNPAVNVIAARAQAAFNIRFNDRWTEDGLRTQIIDRLDRAAADARLRPGRQGPVDYTIEWIKPVSPVFVTRERALSDTLAKSVAAVTGETPELSTSGGTSDARFIKDYCPVVEFGLVGKTMHMVDERVALEELETLTAIYADFITRWFDR
ncbi:MULTISPECIES: succinyl-diaminopimelate desuccinylase [unclassified Roseitalea]|uniref:succinyl-diaminopimelate desuccinylase n=1 Tax=unclassified Roseitalea TaxID=2639107 RepID=UPI00273DE1F7|nr:MULTISPECIES: succinyl-diaminopimelate desuccinylase [unclassified Roseitalea]